MRKLALGLVALTAVAAPIASLGDDIPDGKACRSKDQATVTTIANGSDEADRVAICVTQGGVTVLYFGGEMQSEDPRNDGFADTCGAIIVADQNVAQGKYGEDWDNAGEDGKKGTKDDFHC